MEPTIVPQAGIDCGTGGEFESLQARTLLCFTALHSLEGSLRSRLALCLGAGPHTTAACLAVLALGGACLMVDEDRTCLHEASRAGAVDFVVNGLSEALRILKNEVRRGTAVSVGLTCAPEQALAEMLQRGVQPDRVLIDAAGERSVSLFLERGATLVQLPPVLSPVTSAWRLQCDKAASLAERRERDAAMLDWIHAGSAKDPELAAQRVRWLRAAAALFPKDRARVHWSAE